MYVYIVHVTAYYQADGREAKGKGHRFLQNADAHRKGDAHGHGKHKYPGHRNDHVIVSKYQKRDRAQRGKDAHTAVAPSVAGITAKDFSAAHKDV